MRSRAVGLSVCLALALGFCGTGNAADPSVHAAVDSSDVPLPPLVKPGVRAAAAPSTLDAIKQLLLLFAKIKASQAAPAAPAAPASPSAPPSADTPPAAGGDAPAAPPPAPPAAAPPASPLPPAQLAQLLQLLAKVSGSKAAAPASDDADFRAAGYDFV